MTTKVEITTTTVTNTNEVADLTSRAAEARALWNEFQETKATIKALEAKKEAADALLREMLGDAEFAIVDGEKLFGLAHSSNTSFDSKILLDGWPEAHKAAKRTKPYTFLKAM